MLKTFIPVLIGQAVFTLLESLHSFVDYDKYLYVNKE